MGWYSDGHVTINAQSSSFSGKLIGIDDYDQGNLGDNKIIVKVEGADTDHYVMFNLATGINAEVEEGGNLVLVTSRESEPGAAESIR